jgi:hypothetical protein
VIEREREREREKLNQLGMEILTVKIIKITTIRNVMPAG